MSRELPWNLRTTGTPVARPVFGDAKQLRDAGGIRIKQCPVTGGVPTRMTEASFKRACAGHRRQTGKTSYNYQIKERKVDLSACARCKGKKRPTELTIITDEEVREMGKPARNMGKCQNCGESAMVTKNNGLLVCSSCSSIQAAVKNRLEAVANAARSLHKAEELVGLLVGPEGLRAAASDAYNNTLRTIAGIVGYEGKDGEELVEAVRKRVQTCASCDAEAVLREIREIVGYTDDRGDSRLAEVVRQQLAGQGVFDCTACTDLKGDLLRACELDLDLGTAQDWDYIAAAAIHEMAKLQDRRDHWVAKATWYQSGENTANEKLQDALGKLAVANNTICELSAKCDRLEAETAAFEAENTRLREQQPESIGLLDVALAVIREEPVPAGKIASLIEAARGRAA